MAHAVDAGHASGATDGAANLARRADAAAQVDVTVEGLHADPAGDLPAAVVALDATIVVAGSSGQRSIPARQFFTDVFTTALAPDDVLVEVRVPRMPGWTAS